MNDALEMIEGDPASRLLILCDHASNAIPAEYADLGLPRSELSRHIAYDIGCGPLSRTLAERMKTTAILTRVSRLVIDANRGEDDPTLIMRLSDGAIVPGNRDLEAGERERRLTRFYRPYHDTVGKWIDSAISAGRVPAILSIHSFNPEWKGVPRPWHVGVLWDRDGRMARPLIERLGSVRGLFVGDNEPYSGALRNDTMFRHGTLRGLPHALLEIRNDLIATPGGVLEWADRLVPVLDEVLANHDLFRIESFGSATDRSPP